MHVGLLRYKFWQLIGMFSTSSLVDFEFAQRYFQSCQDSKIWFLLGWERKSRLAHAY